MSDLLRWISPFDPRGMSVYGSLAVIVLSVGLWSVNGTLPEIWPHRCSLFKAQLVRNAHPNNGPARHLLVVADPSADLDQHNLWEIKVPQGQPSWFIPRGDYVEARLSHHLPTSISIQLVRRSGGSVTARLRPDYQAFDLYAYLVGAATQERPSGVTSLSPAVVAPPTSLVRAGVDAQHLWGGRLNRRALRLTPDQVSCRPDQTVKEVVDVLALTLKHADQGLARAWILNTHNHLSEYTLEGKVSRRLYRDLRVGPRSYQWVWMWEDPPKDPAARSTDQPQPWLLDLINDVEMIARDPQASAHRSVEHLVVTPTHSLSDQRSER